MHLNLNLIRQFAVSVTDIVRSESFYESVLGRRMICRFGDLAFYYCAAVRMLLAKVDDPGRLAPIG